MERDRVEIAFYPDHYVQSAELHPMQNLAEVLRERGHGTALIGVEMDNCCFSAKAYATLDGSLPGADLIDATLLANWPRGVKSDEEIDFMRRAARIAEKVVMTAIDLSRPGLRKNDLAAAIMKAGAEGVDEDWGDYPAIVPLLPNGPDAAAPHLTWNGDEMQGDELTFFELGGCYRRDHIPLCRGV